MALPKYHPHIGQRFGFLTVASGAFRDGRLRRVQCRCDCGAEKPVTICKLFSGETASCGCAKVDRARKMGRQNRKHGHASDGRSPTYISWQSMIGRCYVQTTKSYSAYGGRGIQVCDQWRGENGFARFLQDMGPRPDGLTLDRIDVNGDYFPENCRWVDWSTQYKNRRA